MTKDICKGCGFLNGDLCKLHDNEPLKDIKYVLYETDIDCGCPYRAESGSDTNDKEILTEADKKLLTKETIDELAKIWKGE